MKPTPKQIELSKQIWEAGVRVDEFEWGILNTANGFEIECRCVDFYEDETEVVYKRHDENIKLWVLKEELIPILDFETAVEWFKQKSKSWRFYKLHEDCMGKFYIEIELLGTAQTIKKGGVNNPTEAILACVLEVVRRGK